LSLIATAAKLEAGGKEKPQRGAGGLELGLLIFETKTHPVTDHITTDHRIRFLRVPERKRPSTIAAR
jgi:hypothetical protein